MLRALNIGRLQSPSLVLSRRRAIRRLLLCSFRATVGFTRNPSWFRGWEERVHPLRPRNSREISSFFPGILPPAVGGYAYLRTSDCYAYVAQIAHVGMHGG